MGFGQGRAAFVETHEQVGAGCVPVLPPALSEFHPQGCAAAFLGGVGAEQFPQQNIAQFFRGFGDAPQQFQAGDAGAVDAGQTAAEDFTDGVGIAEQEDQSKALLPTQGLLEVGPGPFAFLREAADVLVVHGRVRHRGLAYSRAEGVRRTRVRRSGSS